MPAILVHGNPETPAIWGPLRSHLKRSDVTALRLPGFGEPAPDGFGGTKEEYVAWLTAELEAVGEPVDLVGHDWGGGFVLRVACLRPDLIRTWCSDVAGILDPAYVWHDFAQIWQKAGEGEAFFEAQNAMPRDERLTMMAGLGISGDVGEDIVDAGGPEMARCVLALYRSAAQPAMTVWGEESEAASARPGLVIAAENDHFTGGVDAARRSAQRMSADFVVLPDVGHWWMLQNPALGAATLEQFWAGR